MLLMLVTLFHSANHERVFMYICIVVVYIFRTGFGDMVLAAGLNLAEGRSPCPLLFHIYLWSEALAVTGPATALIIVPP